MAIFLIVVKGLFCRLERDFINKISSSSASLSSAKSLKVKCQKRYKLSSRLKFWARYDEKKYYLCGLRQSAFEGKIVYRPSAIFP